MVIIHEPCSPSNHDGLQQLWFMTNYQVSNVGCYGPINLIIIRASAKATLFPCMFSGGGGGCSKSFSLEVRQIH